MATQAIGLNVEVNGREHNPGKIANFIETVKDLAGVYFNTNGGSTVLDPSHRAKLTVEEKSEVDAYMNGVGPAKDRQIHFRGGEESTRTRPST